MTRPETNIHVGDVVEQLEQFPDGTFHTVITSPPYWRLRDYGCDGQLGLEDTPQEHVEAMVRVFEAVRRVLRPDGTLWMNYGDTYMGDGANAAGPANRPAKRAKRGASLKPKDLAGIPWRVALALQAAGWWLRADCIWSKPNAIPEPGNRGRPCVSHEYVFLLTRSADCYYDSDAVRVPASADGKTRNLRTVWEIPTEGFKGEHFASFPTALVEPLLLASTSEYANCCECSAPFARVVEATGGTIGRGWHDHSADGVTGQQKNGAGIAGDYKRRTLGWEPTCECERNVRKSRTIRSRVLDPFGGTGTVALVAQRLTIGGKRRIATDLVDIDPDSAEIARQRVYDDAPLFSKPEVSR